MIIHSTFAQLCHIFYFTITIHKMMEDNQIAYILDLMLEYSLSLLIF